jgi:steroid delta-isomerase-like uncharacterized protein
MGTLFERLLQVNELAAQHRYDELVPFFTDDVRGWSPTYDVTNRDEWLARLRLQNDPMSEIEVTVTPVAETADTLVFEWVWSGLHTGPIQTPAFSLPATGKRLSIRGMSVYEFTGDRISAFRQYMDRAELAEQLAG